MNRPGLVALLAVALLSGSGGTSVAGGQRTAAGGAADSSAVVLTLLHTNDLHGRVYLPGQPQGLAKIATMARQIRAEGGRVLLLDGGDIIHGTPEMLAFGGRPMIEAMNATGFDAAVSGNHEFDFGQRVTRAAFSAAAFPMLSANVLDTKTRLPWGGLQPYVIRNVRGIRVAIFGLTTVQTVDIEWPRTLEGITFADPIETARALVPLLRSREHADVVIALTHLGVSVDSALARAVPGIDVVLGGHSHTRLSQQVWVDNSLITQTWSYARLLGRTDLLLARTDSGGYRIREVNGRDGRWWGRAGVASPDGRAYPSTALLPLR
nr:metallophosphatase [Gemmatimonadaceae bacterium]